MKNFTFFFASLFLTLFLSACQFDLSPWETDVDCPNMTIDENLEWLAQIEQTKQIGDEFKVAVIGDPQQFPGDLEATIKHLNQMDDVDFILLLGDVVETGIEKEYEWACKALNKTQKPIISVVGNHDSLSYGKEIWLKVFGEFDFTFHYLGTKFIAYNDNKYEFENVPDRDWLRQQAQLDEQEVRYHTIGMSHIEPWASDPDLSGFLKESGYTHMLHAHRHRFDFWQEAGIELPHYVTADIQDIKFGLMTVTKESISMQDCDPNCLPASLDYR